MTPDVARRLRALAATRWIDRSDEATRAALGEGADEIERLTAQARGAQYREREALATVAMLRVALERALDERDEAENRVENLEIALTIGPRVDEMRAVLAGAADLSDLTAFARREAGPVTPHQWRQCSTCGRCFWLADTEAVPAHRVAVLGVERACGWAGGDGGRGG